MSVLSYVNGNSSLLWIPTPSSISYAWNMGSLLGIFLIVQIVTGLVISFHYSSSVNEAFDSVVYISEDVPYGWIVRSAHANGASFFFMMIYAHLGRGLFYNSFNGYAPWGAGVVIFLLSMGTAFLGYVLPWGQMSYWGATVITNLLSAFPCGGDLVVWIWGGFSVGGPTLSRFFSLHFLLPFVILVMVVVHIFFLHDNGSQNPLGVCMDSDKVYFHPLFTVNDLVGFLVVGFFYVSVSVCSPDLFIDPDNFLPANSLSTPAHIQPEWYFLFAYAILRSIPSKLGGVIALLSSILFLLILPFLSSSPKGGVSVVIFWSIVGVFSLLTWVGSMPVEGSLVLLGQVLSVLYFLLLAGIALV